MKPQRRRKGAKKEKIYTHITPHFHWITPQKETKRSKNKHESQKGAKKKPERRQSD